jgi:hypothetical protein
MSIDRNTAEVLVALFAMLNTALLVYQAVRLQGVHSAVNGAKDAALSAARNAGFAAAYAQDKGQGTAPPGPPPPPPQVAP